MDVYIPLSENGCEMQVAPSSGKSSSSLSADEDPTKALPHIRTIGTSSGAFRLGRISDVSENP